jgi:Glycosyl hydrolases family 2
MNGSIEIIVRDVSDVEGHVFAQYNAPIGGRMGDEPVAMRGTLRGPYCKRAHTLPAEIAFRDLGPKEKALAVAIVPDPCVWSPELPHLYQVDIEARKGERVLAEYHGMIGLRATPKERE